MHEFTLRGGPGSWVEVEVEAKRSRFLCRIVRVESEAAARDIVGSARERNGDARHHCSAIVLGSSADPDQVRRSNDDGEPSGTAGRPMLEVLTGRNLIDCVAVVSRYFGGTLLGTGGLIRAYSDATVATADEAAASNRLIQRARRELFLLPLPHDEAGRVEADLRQYGATVIGTAYGASAVIKLAVELGAGAALAQRVAHVTAGARMLESVGTEWVDVEPQIL